ncbi:MAG: hypothetical protein LC650_01600 [Actinobacteria bacterium]|nr:hypothetical protein [Actinomycetota bacterium]
MKLRLTVVAEFEPDPKYYEEFTPGVVLATEQANLADMGVEYYLGVFDDDDDIKTTLQIVELESPEA